MRRTHSARVPALVAAAAVLSLGLVAAPDTALARRAEPKVVQDLHWGEVLFYFYQQDYFAAITRLRAARRLQQLPHHDAEGELLLGGLYLSYGNHNQAGEIFQRLLQGQVSDEMRDRIWFYLAKIWYQRSYLAEAEVALARIGDNLSRELTAEKVMLHAQVLMQSGRFAEAAEVLENWKVPKDWVTYARYNLGVALVRNGDVDSGAKLLLGVGGVEARSEEMRALRDKANVALGYAYLQADRPAEAKPHLQRVRMDGPFSNKALLGVGWADASEDNYRRALVPWMELRRRDLLDSAVQESLLAIPYAFSKLDANAQAADHYLDAVEAYAEEMNRLDAAAEAIRRGHFIEALLADDNQADQRGWFWTMGDLPDGAESRYLYHLMAGHEFQEALKNYRDLKFLETNLNAWEQSVEAFDNMLETRQIAFDQRTPRIDSALASADVDAMDRYRQELVSRINEIQKSGDPVALATEDEHFLWSDLMRVEGELGALPRDPELDELRDKQRLLKGVLLWKMNEKFKARLWRQRKELRDVERALREAKRRYLAVSNERDNAQENFVQFGGQIEALRPRIAALRDRTQVALAAQRAFMERDAIAELLARKDRLDVYMVQARFALATIYDRAAGTTVSAEGTP